MNNLFATPALWYPNQSEAEFKQEIALMVERANVTAAFLRQEVDPETFLDYLDEQDFDVFELVEDWVDDG